MKTVIIAVLAVIAIIGGAVLLGNSGQEEQSQGGTVSSNFVGPENATVVVTEYADFQCPACSQFSVIFSEVKELYKDRVKFEFFHFPLSQIHPNAIAAHRAAQASALQGKFWEMHDLLYERQSIWASSTSAPTVFRGYADELGLDMTKYDSEVSSSAVLATINADTAQGKDKDVNSTPTFIINGSKVDNTSIASPEDFGNYLDRLLEEQQNSSNSTTNDAEQSGSTSDTPEATTTE